MRQSKKLSYKYNKYIFVDDSQCFPDINELVAKMSEFAEEFFPNPVIYQVGYRSDQKWWGKYKYPVESIGKKLLQKTSPTFDNTAKKSRISTSNQEFKNAKHQVDAG